MITMTQVQNKQLADLLHSFYQIAPDTTAMGRLVEERWTPFLDSLYSDGDRAFALTAYFDLVNYNFSQLLIHLGQLNKDEIAVFYPMLASFKELENEFKAVIEQKKRN